MLALLQHALKLPTFLSKIVLFLFENNMVVDAFVDLSQLVMSALAFGFVIFFFS